ncbi:MAG TPA: hypothetical protein VFO36_06870, partial [Nitrospiraceae bacterium]|nr:hypothetical protein [Nitrospiraceae bacterium]
MTDSERYELAVRLACKTALDAGETSLRELLHAADGADPSVVVTALGALHAQGEIDDVLWDALRESARRAPRPSMPADGPIPHPLDYVWHFDDTTIKA